MKRDWSKIVRTFYYAVLSERGKILPSTIRTKPGDSEAALFLNAGLQHRNDPTKTKTVRVKVTVEEPGSQEIERDELVEEIEACHAMLIEALSHVDPDTGSGEEFQAKLLDFLIDRNLYEPPTT